MKFKVTLSKKHKFALLSIAICGLFYYSLVTSTPVIGWLVLLSIVGTYFVQSSNFKLRPFNFLSINILTLHLIFGAYLSFLFFPNLGYNFKLMAILAIGVLYYICCLINNVFLVVDEREELIPLYRVATTWSRISIVVIAIAYFAGVFKLPVNTFAQCTIVAVSTALLVLYILWSIRFDKDSKKMKRGEMAFIATLASFILYAVNVSVSFFPTESFLRALFVSTALMFSINLVYGHCKNDIKKRMLTEHFFISFTFFVLLIIFRP